MRNMSIFAVVGVMVLTTGLDAGVYGVRIDTSPDRVESPLAVNMTRIGTLRPRGVGEIQGQNWRLGCETLDRDYANFDEYKEFVAPLGIKTVRLQGGWAKCERTKGQYDFAWLDHIVDTLRAQGVACAIETDYGNPIYEGGGGWDLAGGFPTSAEALAAWDGWVDALTKHFRGRVRIWMMWNEPDIGAPEKTPEMIAAFNVRTANIVRRNIPDAHLAGLSLARNRREFFEDCLKAMGDDVKLFDTFVYHGYKRAPESSYAAVEEMKTVLAKYHPSARLWQGENGCPSEMTTKFALDHASWSEYSQAKWNMRRMLGDLGHDVYSSVFTICDFSHVGREINSKGLLRANEEKEVVAIKRAYYAVQNVVSVFDDSWTRVKDGSFSTKDLSLSAYQYVRTTGEPLFVFWTHGRDYVKDGGPDGVLGEGEWSLPYERPGDSFATRPAVFRYAGKPLADPVWIDLLTGRVYAFPKKNQLVARNSVRFIDVPVYDSPCLLTERKAIIVRPTEGDRETQVFGDMRAGFPRIVKRGAVSPNGEASPFVWKGRLMRMENVDLSGGLDAKDPSIRSVIRDVETGKLVSEKGFASDCYYRALYCENGRAYVTCVQRGETGFASGTILLYESDDLVAWSRRVLFEDKRFRFFNTTLTKGPDGYVLGLETSDRSEAKVPFTMFFATSKDLKEFKLMPLDRAYPKDRYCGGPFLHYHDGWYYLSLVTALPCFRFCTYVVRTRDFVEWEVGKYNPLIVCSEEDRTIAPDAADITPEKAKRIREGFIGSASDLEMCEFKGRTYLTYNAGNQSGHYYLCDAWYDGPMGVFLENLFR